jgi:hypothetical protein
VKLPRLASIGVAAAAVLVAAGCTSTLTPTQTTVTLQPSAQPSSAAPPSVPPSSVGPPSAPPGGGSTGVVPSTHVSAPPTSVSAPPVGTGTFDLAGVLTLYGSGATVGQTCEGVGDYTDIVKGTEISVYNTQQTLVGLGTLSDGVQTADGCVFTFAVQNLPTNAGANGGWLVGVSDRGTVAFSNEEFSHIVYLSLGN